MQFVRPLTALVVMSPLLAACNVPALYTYRAEVGYYQGSEQRWFSALINLMTPACPKRPLILTISTASMPDARFRGLAAECKARMFSPR